MLSLDIIDITDIFRVDTRFKQRNTKKTCRKQNDWNKQKCGGKNCIIY